MKNSIIIIGASGHAKVVADIAEKCKYKIIGFLDDDDTKNQVYEYPVLGTIAEADSYIGKSLFFIGIGNNEIRRNIVALGKHQWATLIHPTAVMANHTEVGCGTVVMANAVINSSAKIGEHCIINTGSIIEHECIIEDYVHISPGVSLGGNVKIGSGTHVGIGAVVRNNITIGRNVVIGAGAVVVKDISDNMTVTGVPARPIIQK